MLDLSCVGKLFVAVLMAYRAYQRFHLCELFRTESFIVSDSSSSSALKSLEFCY